MIPTINSYILQQFLPDAELILYPDAGHGSHFQYPELFVRHARIFLDGQALPDGDPMMTGDRTGRLSHNSNAGEAVRPRFHRRKRVNAESR